MSKGYMVIKVGLTKELELKFKKIKERCDKISAENKRLSCENKDLKKRIKYLSSFLNKSDSMI